MHGYWYNGFDNMMNNGFDNMMNFGYENSWWFMIYDGLKLLVIIGAVIFIAKMLMNRSNNDHASNSNRAINILKERYARGEISEEEYRDKLNKLTE